MKITDFIIRIKENARKNAIKKQSIYFENKTSNEEPIQDNQLLTNHQKHQEELSSFIEQLKG